MFATLNQCSLAPVKIVVNPTVDEVNVDINFEIVGSSANDDAQGVVFGQPSPRGGMNDLVLV